MKTLKHLSVSVLSFALVIILLSGCKKDKDENKNSSKNVKYEISGTYTGKFTVIITDNDSGTQTINEVSIPWSKEVTYGDKVVGIGIGVTPTDYGKTGQTAVMRIYSGGTVVKTSNATADQTGLIAIPTLSHVF